MKQSLRYLVPAAVAMAALFAGWRVVGQMQAERHASSDPARALRWRPADPTALLALAERQLAEGDAAAARATATRLLGHEPLQGQAFRVLAAASERDGDEARTLQLYRIAARRAPRDRATRAWLARYFLQRGDYPQALVQIDALLRVAPQRADKIHPALVQLAQDPKFAQALAQSLRDDPPWRAGVLAALRHPKTGNPLAAGQVMQALQDRGGLSADEYSRWLDSLIAQGRWGEAYARWAGTAVKPNGRLPLLYNGDFAQEPSEAGFDWRRRRVPGVLMEFEPGKEVGSRIVHLQFLGRRVPNAGLEQALMLAPGRYRLLLRARARALRSEMGLQWRIACAGPARVVGRSEALQGSFDWMDVDMEFTVPPAGCPGQWLRLENPVPSGAGQQVAGDLWLTGFRLKQKPE
ncbi:tetratricopeptide repeat protein [Thermomonas fusca]|uniref:Uncharacterized protein n=1 Tax=Thermomonas fusca TaxID=215690 RepID=A0A5R9PGS6_9GAMM|nr:hypothetical protein [Thermomonas fusca]TLX22277.1 hypothetical protein E5S66_07140 [Thermomonas fusca]